jgi:hypothetical protein
MITALGNKDPRFYQLLGPYLSRRTVVEFVGGPIWDDDGKVWFVAHTDARVHGFAGVTRQGGRTVVESMYITDPNDRDTAVRVVTAAARAFGRDNPLHATVRHDRLYAYEAAGFVKRSDTVNFAKLFRVATPAGGRS